MTKEQMRDEFLRNIAGVVEYWRRESRAPTTLAKMNGLVHSILATLDGENAYLPAFSVVPQVEEGRDEIGNIAGELHDIWDRFKPMI